MLNIYHGPEYIDKSRFIFEHISGRTLLLVPDQFSLQAEKDALYYLGTDSLMDLRVVDLSTLGHKTVAERQIRQAYAPDEDNKRSRRGT